MNRAAIQLEPRPGWRRPLLMRLLAVVVGLTPFLFAEAVLRLTGWRPTSPAVDPFVGFHAIKPLFELAEDGRTMAIPKWRQEFFQPQRFLARKPADEFRIFCLGGSTVQGRPYSTQTSFTKWLELSLNAAAPARRWKVVNCGGVSYASYRLAPVMQECLDYEPDLFILYTGHNEFLEERSYQNAKSPSPAALAIHETASHSKLYQWTLSLQSPEPQRGTVLPQEVDALLDYRGGLETYHRDPAWRANVVQHYGINVRRMIRLARENDVPLLLVAPVSNIRDCPPFKIEPDPRLDKSTRQTTERLFEEGKRLAEDDPAAAIPILEQTLQLDPEHPGAWFLLGRCRLALNQIEPSQQALIAAKDFDVCPLRMTEPLHRELLAAAREEQIPFVDARAYFEKQAEQGLVGDRQLIDHVHPRIEGHQAIADLLLKTMVEQRFLEPQEDWQGRRRAAYREHFQSAVDEAYMARGQQRLEGLQRWATGRAYKVRTP